MVDPARETIRWHGSIVWTEVTIINEAAEMSLAAFDKLRNYSGSIPSGAYIGKRWKRREPYLLSTPGKWLMGEYTDINDPEEVGIIWRNIYLSYPSLPATDENVVKAHDAAKVAAAL